MMSYGASVKSCGEVGGGLLWRMADLGVFRMVLRLGSHVFILEAGSWSVGLPGWGWVLA